MPRKKKQQASITLRRGLMKLQHDDKEAFLRIVAEMVEVLADPDFRETAALHSSWPVNVPALETRGTRKISPGAPRRTWVISRETKCHQVLDERLQVGSGLALNLSPAKRPKLDDPMTGLAFEVAVIMAAVCARNIDVNRLSYMLGIETPKKRFIMLQQWCDSVEGLPRSGKNARSKWVELGFSFAQMRYHRSLKKFTGLDRWVENLKGESKLLHSKTRKGKEGFLKNRFAQAFSPFLKLE